MEGERMRFIDAVMMEGCPHCGDGVPKIVTFHHRKPSEEVHYVGDWDEAEKAACTRLGELRIIACRSIESAEFQEGAADE
jgi:hypothetical protein